MEKPFNYYSTTLDKGLAILRLFDRDHPNWNLTQIAQAIGINKTSAFRFVNTLVHLGYLRKHPQTKLISLGPQVIDLALAYSQTENLVEISKPFIDEVSESYNLTTEVALFEGDLIVVIYRKESKDASLPRFPVTRISERFYCSSLGKAVVAHLPKDEMMDIIEKTSLVPVTPHTITKKAKLLADLKETRERGYALNNEEWSLGLIAIGAPLLNLHTNKVAGAVCFDFSTSQGSIKMVENKYSEVLLKLGKAISQALTIQY